MTPVRSVYDLPLPLKQNGRITIYEHLDDLLRQYLPDMKDGTRLPYTVKNLYQRDGQSGKHVASVLTLKTGYTVYPGLLYKMLRDFGIERKAFKECVRGRPHAQNLVLSSAQRNALAGQLPQYDEHTRQLAQTLHVHLLDQVPVEGNVRGFMERMMVYCSLDAVLHNASGATLPLVLYDLYVNQNMACQQIAQTISATTAMPVTESRVHRMIRDFDIAKKPHSAALLGKTRQKKAQHATDRTQATTSLLSSPAR